MGDAERENGSGSGRTCGSCRVCCKAPPIPELDKPQDTWCAHAVLDRSDHGCAIYDDRPQGCRSFRCGWLQGLGAEADRPDRLGVMIQMVELPEGGPGVALVEARPGALADERAQKWIAALQADNPGRVALRRVGEAHFRRVGLTVGGRRVAG